jgi:hypothetical protein
MLGWRYPERKISKYLIVSEYGIRVMEKGWLSWGAGSINKNIQARGPLENPEYD